MIIDDKEYFDFIHNDREFFINKQAFIENISIIGFYIDECNQKHEIGNRSLYAEIARKKIIACSSQLKKAKAEQKELKLEILRLNNEKIAYTDKHNINKQNKELIEALIACIKMMERENNPCTPKEQAGQYWNEEKQIDERLLKEW